MTPTLFLAAMLCVAADSAPTAAFEFNDSAAFEKRVVLQYRAIEFRDTPVKPLKEERKFANGAMYGVVPVGPKPETALAIVWLPKAAGGAELWLDSNGDGRFADGERHVMKDRSIEIPATITVELDPPKKVDRTLVFRRSTLGDGLRYSVRGYMQGRLELAGSAKGDSPFLGAVPIFAPGTVPVFAPGTEPVFAPAVPALLVDGNANGCFGDVGQDRVWLDLNGDGRFDPLTEQFPLGKPIGHSGEVYVVSCDATASNVHAKLRSAGQGKLRLKLAKKLPSAKLSAELVSDLGELVVIDKLDEATTVPYGQYRIAGLKLETPDANGETWTYNFYNEQAKNYAVETDKETAVTILGQLEMNISFGYGAVTPAAGETFSIQPKLLADGSLYLSSCTVGKDTMSRQAEGNAEILLLGPDGKVENRGLTGFS